ncbi:globin domain-containing protein [Streptomyces sp. SID11385]|uniref:globin domain-containing protein n=1 Tax=Streptomyces sp. SID11385 TaxID=2706031 RepID=UPI0013C5F478|nr:globin domain-containing protein [Streptomyces sp. SID11385]NEA41266.1 hemin transporter [Streptomyces sp. SID11385]
MLSPQATPVVRATLPVVGAHIEEIARVFYRRLFAAHPELLRDLFNRGNQHSGEQQKALAGSIATFATLLLDQPDARPDAVLARIAHKHVSLGVTPAQYEVVHTHLFAAIGEVLGEAVTPGVAAAWDEVYWLMAHALIALEKDLYARGGGEVWRPMEITGRRDEGEDAVSFTLRRVDGEPAGSFRPGQYVSVRTALPDGAHQIRQYSLASAPGEKEWRITVRRDGEVSGHLHGNARAGHVLDVSMPCGDVGLDEGADGPLLLASAGIGVTPMLSMLGSLAASGSGRPVLALHADRSPAHHAHREEQAELVDALAGAELVTWYEDGADGAAARAGRIESLDGLDVREGVSAYLCGPVGFMRRVRGLLLERGVPAADIHYEVFGPDLGLDVR